MYRSLGDSLEMPKLAMHLSPNNHAIRGTIVVSVH